MDNNTATILPSRVSSPRWLGLALFVASGGVCASNDLQIHSDGLLSVARTGQPASLQVLISNQGSDSLRDLRWKSGMHSLQCADSSNAGHSFVEGGDLAAGDAIACELPAASLGRSISGAVVVSARDSGNQMQLAHTSLSLRTPRAALNQAAVVVIGGAVHADANSNGLYEVGESIAYHYTVYNAGTLSLTAISLSDVSGAVTCPQTSLAVAAHMNCTRSYAVTAGDQSAGLIVNSVDANASASSGPVQGGDVLVNVNLAGSASIRVFKSPQLQDDVDGDNRASVGDLVRYTFLTKNSGAQTLTALNLTEPDPSRIDTPITCSANTLNGQALGALGSATLQSNDVAVCTADYTIRSGDQLLGQANNLVVADANAAVGGAINGSGSSSVVIPANPQIAVTKSVSTAATQPGESVTYTLTVSNVGVTDVVNLTISDPLPIGINAFAWTCTASAAATCPNASGSGAINQTIALFPAGGELVYSVIATVAEDAPEQVLNTVSVSPPGITVCMPNATPGPCSASIPLIVREPYVSPSAVPIDNRWLLSVMALGLVVLVARRRRLN